MLSHPSRLVNIFYQNLYILQITEEKSLDNFNYIFLNI